MHILQITRIIEKTWAETVILSLSVRTWITCFRTGRLSDSFVTYVWFRLVKLETDERLAPPAGALRELARQHSSSSPIENTIRVGRVEACPGQPRVVVRTPQSKLRAVLSHRDSSMRIKRKSDKLRSFSLDFLWHLYSSPLKEEA